MKLTRWYIGSGGVKKVHVPRLVSEAFGVSQSEARRLVHDEQVTLDGEVLTLADAPLEDLAGRRLAVGREGVDLEA